MRGSSLSRYLLWVGVGLGLNGCSRSTTPPVPPQSSVQVVETTVEKKTSGSSPSTTIETRAIKTKANGGEENSLTAWGERLALKRDGGVLAWPPQSEWGLPETAADALSRIGADAVIPLIGALQDPDSQVRLQAARALAKIGPEAAAAVPALKIALSDSDSVVRQNAARALGQIGPASKNAVPELIRALHSDK